MGDNMRPIDLATLLAIIAAVVVIVAASAPPRLPAPIVGPLSVDEATTLVLDTPVVVSGYLVGQGARTYLCDAPRCSGVRLAVVGPGPGGVHSHVLVAGVVSGAEIALLRFPSSRRTGAF
jgi:hypothetical protein